MSKEVSRKLWVLGSFCPLFGLLHLASGCGVKGDPLPPESPAHIGRGAPEMSERLKLMERQGQENFMDFTRDEDEEDER